MIYYTEDASVYKRGTIKRMRTPDRSAETARKPRTDAIRNRERVLEAAKAVFSAGGADASLEAVARKAGVGIGTLYRHFPTREALFEAVSRHEVDELAALAEQLAEAAPVEALRRWLHSNVEFIATKKGMATAMALAGQGTPELRAYSFNHLTTAIRALLARAVAAGEILIALSAEDVLRALGAAQVTVAPTVATAKQAIEAGKIDLAVLDFNLGTETSLPIAEELVALGLPVVMATGYGSELDLPGSLKDVPIVTKPYDLVTLSPKIAQAMRR